MASRTRVCIRGLTHAGDPRAVLSAHIPNRSSNFFQGTSTIQKFGRFSVNPLSRVSAAPQAATNGHVTIDIKEDEPNNGNGPGNDTERGSRDIHANSVNVASILRSIRFAFCEVPQSAAIGHANVQRHGSPDAGGTRQPCASRSRRSP